MLDNDCSLNVVDGIVAVNASSSGLGSTYLITPYQLEDSVKSDKTCKFFSNFKWKFPKICTMTNDFCVPVCTCQANVDVSSTCHAQELYPSKIGEFEEICSFNDIRVYGHIDSFTISYLYYINDEQLWALSPQIGDKYAWVGKPTKQICPEDEIEGEEWSVFTGDVSSMELHTYINGCS